MYDGGFSEAVDLSEENSISIFFFAILLISQNSLTRDCVIDLQVGLGKQG